MLTLVPQQPHETREFLERQMQGRQKPTKRQEAPGAGGGLFDNNAQQPRLI
jgi:hypothetical protein